MKPRFSIQPATNRSKRGNVRPIRIVHIDEELWFGKLVEEILKSTLREFNLLSFQNTDAAWSELQHHDPDLLITDMNNGNVPGRNTYRGMGGWMLLPMLAQKKVKYPVLVVSGSFSMPGAEAKARKRAGNLNSYFMAKPFPIDLFRNEILRLLMLKRKL